jgi:SAM-dependent methyltransferase
MSAAAPRHPGHPYFERIGDQLGRAYLRYSFTKGTAQEVAFLLEVMSLAPGARLLDVGCGPGRHAVAFAEAGLAVTGIDVSRRFLDLAAERATAAGVGAALFEVDARRMPFDDEFDAVVSLCQGGFGLMADDDTLVLKRMAEAARPGGIVVLSAFSALFEARHPRAGATFDAATGIVHEVASITGEDGRTSDVDLWTSVYTPRELTLLSIGVGLVPSALWSVEPGDYARRAPTLEHPELLLVARKP